MFLFLFFCQSRRPPKLAAYKSSFWNWPEWNIFLEGKTLRSFWGVQWIDLKPFSSTDRIAGYFFLYFIGWMILCSRKNQLGKGNMDKCYVPMTSSSRPSHQLVHQTFIFVIGSPATFNRARIAFRSKTNGLLIEIFKFWRLWSNPKTVLFGYIIRLSNTKDHFSLFVDSCSSRLIQLHDESN